MDHRRSLYASQPPPPAVTSSNEPGPPPSQPSQLPPAPYYASGLPPPHQQQQQHHHHPQQQPHSQHHHQQHQHQHHSPSAPGPPPPPPPPQQQQHPHAHHQQPYPGPPSNPASSHRPALPPIHPGAYAPSPSTTEQQHLPPFRHPTAPPPPHDPRDVPQEHHPSYNHNRSGHGTPAPVNRSYSHDSGPQRSPLTPAGPGSGPYHPGSGQDGISTPAAPPSYAMEHGAHAGYPPTNGAMPHGLPPPGPPQSHHETHPHQMTPIMEQHYQYPPPGQPMYGAPSYGPTSANLYGQKRKQMRATQACEQCRQRKQKCDEGTPCSFCKENNLSCQYRDTPPAKTDKNMEKILVHMEAHSHSLKTLTEKIETFEARLRKVEDHVPSTHASGSLANSSMHAGDTTMGAESDGPSREEPAADGRRNMEDHRTAPHKLLLLWPSVRQLLVDASVVQNDSYVMEAEDRGVLRIWTRGEGIDENDGTQPGGPASPAPSDESGEGVSAGTPHADGLWGVGFPSTPASDTQRSEPCATEGGLNAQGELDLDVKTISDLYDSYIRHLHIMHPFLDRRRLKKMFDTFMHRYGTGRPRATFAVGREHDADQRPLKRQRSNGASATLSNGPEARRSVQTERSPGNAIIYLVLALGKIFMHRDKLPSFVMDSKLQTNTHVAREIASNRNLTSSSPLSGGLRPSPASPKTTPTTHPTPPSEANLRLAESRSRRASMEGSPSAGGGSRNLDVIPGIAYYAKAAEILGDQGDGNDLVHAQMFLLAGLYKGQLARVKESMSWITMAGRAILNLLDRYKLWNQYYWSAYGEKRGVLEQFQAQIKDTRQSLIVLAAWTCLQLESDINAELKLPTSGIQGVESMLLFPHRVSEDESYRDFNPDGRQEDYDNILLFYTSQLFLRRRLNMIHRELYGAGTDNSSAAEVREILMGHEQILQGWRFQLPPTLAWEDEDPPPQDILAARLRAKYWGTKYLINRPFLDYALHVMPYLHEDPTKTVEDVAKDGHGNPRDKADVKLFSAIRSMGDEEVWRAVERCIYAAMKSTLAFDGVEQRLIVTNIHGTAHAQFGNMLVLTAAYRSKYLRACVPERKFRDLLDRTISFLRGLADISPTCKADCGILEKFKNLLFPAAEEAPDVYAGEGAEWKSSNSDSRSASNSFNAGM